MSAWPTPPKKPNPPSPAPASTVPAVVPDGLDFSRTATPIVATITRAERLALKVGDREEVHANAVKPLVPPFSSDAELLKQSDQGHSFLTNSLDFQKQVKTLKARLETYAIDKPFKMYLVDPASLKPVSADTKNLLDDFSAIQFTTVANNSKMHFKYGDRVTIENLKWSRELILGSCDKDLRAKIETQMAALPPDQDSGPVAFHILATLVVSTSDRVARAIVTKLSTMKLSHFEGEDVTLMAATVRGAIARLKSCNKVPLDIDEIVSDILETTSVFKFRSYFDTLRHTDAAVMKDHEKMLDKAVELYQDLSLKGKWLAAKKKNAAFSAGTSNTPSQGKTSGGNSKVKSHDKNGNKIDRTPPKSGAPTSRTTSTGKTEHWCADCDFKSGRWGNHSTDEHDAFVEKMKNRNNKFREKKAKKKAAAAESGSTTERQTRFQVPEANSAPTTTNSTASTATLAISRTGTSVPF